MRGRFLGLGWAWLVARLVVVVLLVAGGVVTDLGVGARPAVAHAYLLETSPSDGEVLASAPAEVRLRFDEAVSFNERSFQLLDVTAEKLALGVPGHVDGKANTARVGLPAGLAEGTYVLAWRVTSADSHVVSGAFSFSVGHPSATAAAVEQDGSRAVGVVDAVGRAVAFLGVAVALGGALFVVVLWPAGRGDRRGRRVVWSGFAGLAAGTVVVLFAQGPQAAGVSLAGVFDPGLLGATLATRLGHALVARLVIVLALGVVFGIAVGSFPRFGKIGAVGVAAAGGVAGRIVLPALAVLGAVGLVLTWTLADHAQTGVQTWLAVPAAGLHLLAMALWLGGLITLVACVLVPAGRRDPVRVVGLEPVLPRFSGLAQVCFAVIAVTGGYLAWRQVGTWAALVGTMFGWLLLGKLAAVLVVVGLAAGARRFVRRGSRAPLGLDAASSTALRRLRRSVVGEVVLGVVVVSVTAVLVNTAPARTSYAPPVHLTVPIPVAATAVAGAGGGLGGGAVEVRIEPARSGSNVVDIYLTGADGSLVAVPEVAGRLESRGGEVTSLPVKVDAAEPGHYVANSMSVPFPGEWVLRLNIRVSDFDETPVRVPFTAR